MELSYKAKLYLKNLVGKKTNRKIVVIHIDDYGSIRVKNAEARNKMIQAGLPLDNNRYFCFDTLCTTEDLQMMFDVLTSVKDKNGHFACVTPFANVANPDFERIRESGFTQYYRETFVDTFKRLGPAYDGAYELWKQGVSEDIFHPEYHGTEHICVRRFMRALQQRNKSTLLAFDNESVCLSALPGEEQIPFASSVFNIEKPEDNEPLKDYIKAGCGIFKDKLGYYPKQFTPGNGPHSLSLNPTLYDCGIRYIDAGRHMSSPLGNGAFEKHSYYNGKRDKYNMTYIVRNCVFEPYHNSCARNNNAVKICLDNVDVAFKMHAPAIISTHRVNFTGGIEKTHRDESLKQLKAILQEIIKKWPDVEFMNSSQMADELF